MPVFEVASNAVLARAEVMATEPVSDWAFTFAFRLVSAPVLRLPEDLSSTPETPETAPVVKVPALDSRSTMPALLVTVPTEALPVASSVMLPVAVVLPALSVPAAWSVTAPDLAVKVVNFKWPVAPAADTLMPLPAFRASALTPPVCALLSKMSPGTVMAPRLISPAADMSRFWVAVALVSLMPPVALRTTRSPPKAETLAPTMSLCDFSSRFLAGVTRTSVVALFCARAAAPVLLVTCSTGASVSSHLPLALAARAVLPTSPSALTKMPPVALPTLRS